MRVALVLTLILNLAAIANPTFDAGIQSYNQGNWQAAIEQWESITSSGKTSADLEYNLGNAYFRLGNTEKSILHFERSLKMNPNDDDARKNLALANRGIVDQIVQVPTLGVLRYFNSVRDYFSASSARFMLLLANALLAIAVGAVMYSSGAMRDAARRAAYIAGVLTVTSLLIYGWRSVSLSQVSAIVMAEKSDIYSSPSDNSTQLFSLHSGTKVRVGETLSEWTEIQLADGRKGWVPRADIENI